MINPTPPLETSMSQSSITTLKSLTTSYPPPLYPCPSRSPRPYSIHHHHPTTLNLARQKSLSYSIFNVKTTAQLNLQELDKNCACADKDAHH